MFIPDNFMALPPELSGYRRSKSVILPVPYDATLSYMPGSRLGPRAIIEASHNLETFDLELSADPSRTGIHTFPDMEPEMSGPEKMVERVKKACRPLLRDKKFMLMLGGEHTVTVGAVRAFAEKFRDLSVVQIDAHMDLRDEYEGTPYSHACVMRRVSEICPIVQVGIRSGCAEEHEFVRRNRLSPFFAHEMARDPSWMEEAVSRLTDNVYVTVDLDGLDPSVIPAVGTPEPGGLGWFEALAFLRMIFMKKTVVGGDVVELSPLPGSVQGDFAAAKLVYKMIGYKFAL